MSKRNVTHHEMMAENNQKNAIKEVHVLISNTFLPCVSQLYHEVTNTSCSWPTSGAFAYEPRSPIIPVNLGFEMTAVLSSTSLLTTKVALSENQPFYPCYHKGLQSRRTHYQNVPPKNKSRRTQLRSQDVPIREVKTYPNKNQRS